MSQKPMAIEFSKKRAASYFFAGWMISITLLLLFAGGQILFIFAFDADHVGMFKIILISLIGTYIAFFAFFRWFASLCGRRLEYWIEDGCLRIHEGVIIKKRKSIPVERITDVVLVQGPLLSLLGQWRINIQTAGSSNPQMRSEGTLFGVEDPEKARSAILGAK